MTLRDIVHKNYGISISKLTRLTGGFRNCCYKVISNDGKYYVLIVYKREKGVLKQIQNAHNVAMYLDQCGFSVRVPIGSVMVKYRGKYIGLYNFIEGNTVPWEAYTKRHLKSIGKTLSDLHFHLGKYSDVNTLERLPKWADITKQEIKEMKAYFSRVEPWIERKLRIGLPWIEIDKLLSDVLVISVESSTLAGRDLSVLHYDFVRGNVLYSKKLNRKLDIYPIVGIIDFEKVCYGPILADIARTLAFLIIDCKYKGEKEVSRRFLISGYNKRGKNELELNRDSIKKIDKLLGFFWLRDFWKFLENNPYEYLHMNEHYILTRDKLISLGVLTH